MLESVSLWNKLHASPRFRPSYPSEHVVRFLVSARASVPPEIPRRFLDIGTGAGRHMKLAAEMGFFPVGIDVSWTGLCHAHERLESSQIPHVLVSGAMSALPFADNSFSLVLSYGVFYYGTSEDMKRATGEAWRVLCPGGRMLVLVRSTNDYRFGKGLKLERNTFRLDISDTNEVESVQHFLAEEDIPGYFDPCASLSFDLSETTFGNRARLDSDWIITAVK